MNIISGERYKIVPNEVRDYVKGMYGRSPAKIADSFVKQILGDEKPITHRPADNLAPMLPKATDGVDPKFIQGEEDIISYVMLPEPAMAYFQYRATPEDKRPETPADLELKKMVQPQPAPAAVSAKSETEQSAPAQAEFVLPAQFQNVATELLDKIEGITMEELLFRKGDVTISVRPSGVPSSAVSAAGVARSAAPAPAAASSAAAVKAEKAAPAPAKEEKGTTYSKTINAPLTGTYYGSPGPGKDRFVKEGDVVNAGDKVCMVEAMKLFNPITASLKCKIVKIIATDGQVVEKDQPLVGVEPL
jgi:oxaloacetate decarboxylase alpha subunit